MSRNISKNDIIVWCGNDEYFGYLGLIEDSNTLIITVLIGNGENLRFICKRQQFKNIKVIDHLKESTC